jgi:N-acetylated-alpha-linked acidic dipeptidase
MARKSGSSGERMRHSVNFIAVGAMAGLLAGAATAQNAPSDSAALASQLDSHISADEIRDWNKLMSAEPNHVGSPHDKANADWMLAQFKSWGWDAHIETFKVLYPTPVSETLEMLGPKPFTATLQEPPIAGDSSATAKDPAIPAYVAYQGDGDVTAPLVYVNYGNIDDYRRLEQFGISVKGKIVISRYGKGWRGLKVKLAQDHGAVGALIYSDPADDGYSIDAPYPQGAARPPQGIQRGSVMDMMIYPGDPLTPGIGATDNAKRLTREEAVTVMKIPALPISYADAAVMMAAMDGPVAPANWRGHMGITYRVGGGGPPVHLAVKSDWSLKPVYDVIAMLKGASAPDQWVIRGNHHDGWVFGASDPLAGQTAMLAEAKALGAMRKAGWKPKRTIVYTSWDAEEPMLLGSTEWAETHAAELQKKAVLYINSDGNGRGILNIGGSEDLEKFASDTIAGLTDPETGQPVAARRRARLQTAAAGDDHARAMAHQAADPARNIPVEPLGSGSDYTPFLQHLGLATIDFGYGGEGSSGGVYHSRYDTFEHHSRFVDPGFVYDAMLAKTIGRAVLLAANSDLPLQQAGDFAAASAQYASELKNLADSRRGAADSQARLLAAKAYDLAADPKKPHADPTPLKAVPKFDFGPLDEAIAALRRSAAAYDAAAGKGAQLSAKDRARLMALMQALDQTLLLEAGLPGRDWYKNLLYAPGRFTGYGTKTMPGIREAIEDERFDDADKFIGLTAAALKAYAAKLDQATALLNGSAAAVN